MEIEHFYLAVLLAENFFCSGFINRRTELYRGLRDLLSSDSDLLHCGEF